MMKVTVCFGNIRVKVPCSEDANIAELQEKACARYRRAIGKDTSYGVRILKLESAIDGGILDVDDVISDVVEDKEKLNALYEEDEPLQRDWDLGSMTSSEGKGTPPHLPFKSRPDPSNGDYRRNYFLPERRDPNNSLEIDVDNAALKSSTHVMVLRESDSDVTTPTPYSTKGSPYVNSISSPRESAKENGAVGDPRTVKGYRRGSKPKVLNEQNNSKDTDGISGSVSYFRRDVAARQSMGSGLSESTTESSFRPSSPHDYNAAAPMHGDTTRNNFSTQNSTQRPRLLWFYQNSQEINLVNDGSVEGIQVTSFTDDQTNKFAGLLIQSIDQIAQTGRDYLTIGDVIFEINEHLLMDFAFDDAEAMLRESLKQPHVQLRILPVEEAEHYHASPATTSHLRDNPNIVVSSATPPSSANPAPSNGTNSSNDQNQISSRSKLPAVAQLSYDNVNRYTKKIGSRIKVRLKKDISGLGFSLTSRDTTVGESGPIYIKYVLPKGAAIKDGRLLAGDRLLEVNGESVLDKTQEDIVALLRGISIGSEVDITVSRQSETLPRKLKDDPDTDRVIVDDQLKEYFLFDIPLNDTGSAGLGISLKGSQIKRTKEDMGVFVKNVLHGGAAWQDGRLQPNDQLIEVNGHSLRKVSNREAIDILRTSMSTEGNMRGMIEMVIARRKGGHDGSRISSEASSDFSDTILDQTQAISPDAAHSVHSRQASVPSLLLETSFGPYDISDVTSISLHGSSTLGRPTKNKKRSESIHVRSHSSTGETDTLEVDAVNKVREKILHSSASMFLGNLLRASSPAPNITRSVGSNDTYSTWTIPRTNRIPKRSVSLRSGKVTIQPTLEPNPSPCDLRARCAFEKITATELACDGPTEYKSESEHQGGESQISVTSVASSESAQTQQVDSPVNPDVIIGDEDWSDSDSYEPFSRESTIRQSISEKRRDVVQRYSGEAPKLKKALSGDRKEALKSPEQKKLKKRRSNDSTPTKKLDSNSASKLNAQKNRNNSSNSNKNSSFNITSTSDVYDQLGLLGVYSAEQNDEWRIPQNNLQKSASTESLIATAATGNVIPENTLRSHPYRSGSTSSADVGPTLGIAKSSSLESLHTALSYLTVKNESPMRKQGVRGRVLNDSFRAALDQSYPLSRDLATFNHMSTSQGDGDNVVVREEDHRSSTHSSNAPSSDGSLRSLKKRNKLFGLFKKPKPKRPEGENELHKRDLEARREKDFQKMQEEKERIEAKARELRIKQAVEQNKDNLEKNQSRSSNYERPRPPSVPVTSLQWVESNSHDKTRPPQTATGRRSVDPFTRRLEQEQSPDVTDRLAASLRRDNVTSPSGGGKYLSSPPKESFSANFQDRPSRSSPPPVPSRSRRRTKAEHSKHKESVNAYSSLPSLLDIDALESSAPETTLQPTRESSSGENITPGRNHPERGQKANNRDFYHQQKPSTPRKETSGKVTANPPMTSVIRSPEKSATVHYHRREQSPEPPPRTVYSLQGTSPQTVVMRRGTLDQRSPQKRTNNYRHSVFTDQPTTFDYAQKRPTSLTPQQFYKLSTPPGHSFHPKNVTDDVSSTESSSSEAADRNRRAYYKLMHSPQNDGGFEKIEVSVPYNL